MVITNEVFSDYMKCKYRTYQKLKGKQETKSDYELLQIELENNYKKEVIERLIASDKNSTVHLTTLLTTTDLKHGYSFIANTNISFDDVVLEIDALERAPGKSKIGSFYYIPIYFCKDNKITKNHKLLITLSAFVLGQLQGKVPEFGKIMYGKEFKTSKININAFLPQIKIILEEIRQLDIQNIEPQFTIKDYCRICSFCMALALKKDSLSLLKSLPTKEIMKYNNKGIFTVNQLSYTFRAQKRNKRVPPRKTSLFALKALALREKKVFVYGIPSLLSSKNQIYLDIEGDQDDTFRYLIGIVIITPDGKQQYSFWANNNNEEEIILNQFLNVFSKYKTFTVYHYGSYEVKFLKYVKKIYPKYDKAINKILKSCVNILSVIYANIYFPTYSNGLKDIANYLNFQWSEENASGLQSIVWRTKWEMTHDDKLKQQLIQYNMEDCLALVKINEFIHLLIAEHDNKGQSNLSQVAFADDAKYGSFLKWGRITFFYPEFDSINKSSYFDYQRERVFVRTNKKLRKVIKKEADKKHFPIDKKTELTALRCPKCKSYGLLKNTDKQKAKSILDLKFSKHGVKKWIILYSAHKYACPKPSIFCDYAPSGFYPKKYDQLQRHGYALKVFCVYEYVLNKNSLKGIQQYINDLFGFYVRFSDIARMKSQLSKYYKSTYQQIIKRMVKSKVIHIDETQIHLKDKSAYIWVLTNTEEVIFMFKDSREGAFLKKLLKDFKGVLISDFYAAYDSLGCEQQKCLIHLIRDINGDLYENPYDEELKTIAKEFSIILKKIVETIDKYGLKKRHLNKHKKDVNRFFKVIINKEFRSEKAIYYQTRFKK